MDVSSYKITLHVEHVEVHDAQDPDVSYETWTYEGRIKAYPPAEPYADEWISGECLTPEEGADKLIQWFAEHRPFPWKGLRR